MMEENSIDVSVPTEESLDIILKILFFMLALAALAYFIFGRLGIRI